MSLSVIVVSMHLGFISSPSWVVGCIGCLHLRHGVRQLRLAISSGGTGHNTRLVHHRHCCRLTVDSRSVASRLHHDARSHRLGGCRKAIKASERIMVSICLHIHAGTGDTAVATCWQ